MIDYEYLISGIINEIKEKKIALCDDIYILRNENKIVIDYCLKDPKSDNAEKIQVKLVLQEMMKENSILGLVAIKDWAFLNNFETSTVRKKAINGELKTVKKIAGAWFIDPFEEI